MDMKGQFNNPMLHCCFGYPHRLCKLLLSMPHSQWYTLDTLLNELWQILRQSPKNIFWEYSSGELISPVACMCSTHFHSLCIVECAMLNLSVTAVLHCGHQQHGDSLQMLITQQILDASLLEASPTSIICSNWYSKL